MPAADFLDTNVVVYAYDRADPARQRVAQDWVRQAVAGQIATSTQVLAEVAATLLHRLKPPLPSDDVAAILEALSPIPTIATDGEIVHRAVQVRSRYGLHFWDGMIVAAAERAGCTRIWSEDLNPGQSYFGITVENPFRPGAAIPKQS